MTDFFNKLLHRTPTDREAAANGLREAVQKYNDAVKECKRHNLTIGMTNMREYGDNKVLYTVPIIRVDYIQYSRGSDTL